MSLTRISKLFEIYLSDEAGPKKNKPRQLIHDKVFYRFMNRIYLPDHVYNLSSPFVKELNNLREKFSVETIDREFNENVVNSTLKFLKKRFSNKVRILDFGCGEGYSGPFIKDKFPKSTLFGADIRRPFNKKILYGYDQFDLKSINSTLPYTDKYFDIIVSFFVFQFFVSDKQIKELARVIKPNGILFLNLINSADFNILDRLHNEGFNLVKDIEFNTTKNCGSGYFYSLKKD